jgi:hypothetical protein
MASDVSPRGEGRAEARCRIEEQHIGSAWLAASWSANRKLGGCFRVARDRGTTSEKHAPDRPFRQTHFVCAFSLFLLANLLQRPSKRQFVAIRIEHVEVAFPPGRVPRDFRIESSLLQMCPERIHIRNVEDQPAPPRHCVPLFEV